ncbi:immunoglobulin-like domain-containing protein [Paenisporosarcina macmurdoensis]|uniref:Immunoglobulin-like domain-containing protein n=1 Tax=Paenisporosarcina macmurdoensis TaxID=212659 RepID=A0ABW1L8V1_9BACL
MAKISLTLTVIFLLIGLLGCQQKTDKDNASEAVPNSNEGISIKTEKTQYPVSADEIVIIMENNNNSSFNYGLLPSIEKNIDGKWDKISYKKDLAVNAIEQGINSNSKKKESFSLSILKEKLPPGKYRITLTFYNDKNKIILGIPFELVK